jgi:hypothetical protein
VLRFGEAGHVGVDLLADDVFGLDFAELGEGAVQTGESHGTGAVDGFLFFGDCFVVDRSGEGGFNEAATAETPCGAHDFDGEGGFENAEGR